VAETTRAGAEALRVFCRRCFTTIGVPEEDATIAVDILLESDLRGIESHGVPRFEQFYIGGIKDGRINPTPNIQIVHEAPSTALVDGDRGLGMVVGHRAMSIAIKKAEETGAGFVAVRNSRHFGIAGYYATMAMERQMIGWAMTNSPPSVLPAGAAEARLGTNPIAVAAPSADGRHFILDMATSTVSAGKFEVAARKGVPVPPGWGADASGTPTDDPTVARNGQHYSPLGGSLEMASHKGYGLGALVDLLCGVLSGAGPNSMLPRSAPVGHFFGALSIAGFRPVSEFSEMLAGFGETLRTTPSAPGAPPVRLPGDRQMAAKAERLANGIPLYTDTVESLRRLSRDLGVALEL
jgi:L-2-hydroxycarboxylate dehydrogenase (NAD+)